VLRNLVAVPLSAHRREDRSVDLLDGVGRFCAARGKAEASGGAIDHHQLPNFIVGAGVHAPVVGVADVDPGEDGAIAVPVEHALEEGVNL